MFEFVKFKKKKTTLIFHSISQQKMTFLKK